MNAHGQAADQDELHSLVNQKSQEFFVLYHGDLPVFDGVVLGQSRLIQLPDEFKSSAVFRQSLSGRLLEILSEQRQIDPGLRIHLITAVELDRRRRCRNLGGVVACGRRQFRGCFFSRCTHTCILPNRQKIIVVHESWVAAITGVRMPR